MLNPKLAFRKKLKVVSKALTVLQVKTQFGRFSFWNFLLASFHGPQLDRGMVEPEVFIDIERYIVRVEE